MLNVETLDDFKHSRLLENLDCEEQSYEPIIFNQIQINYPTENCKMLILKFFEEKKMSFDQLCQFDSITDLDLLKRSLSDYSETLKIEDEDRFTNFFINDFPFSDDRKNDSVFSIFAIIVSQYYQNPTEIYKIVQQCVLNLSNKYYADIFTAICKNRPYNDLWDIIIQKFLENEIQINDFLKASSGLIKNHIYPSEKKEFIELLKSYPTAGIFQVLKLLNLTREEIQVFGIDSLIIDFLKIPDSKLTADALDFIHEGNNISLLQNEELTVQIFSLLELGNYKQKIKVIAFFGDNMSKIPIDIISALINEGLIEKINEMIYGNALEVQFSSLSIIRFCIYSNDLLSNGINVFERCLRPEIYNAIAELKNSPCNDVSSTATHIINKLDSIANSLTY